MGVTARLGNIEATNPPYRVVIPVYAAVIQKFGRGRDPLYIPALDAVYIYAAYFIMIFPSGMPSNR
jgi:hypothetical protein